MLIMLYQVKKLKVYYKAVYHALKTCYLGKKVYLCTKVPWKSDTNTQKVP